MIAAMDTGLVGLGVYTLPQAAQLARVPAASIRRWLYGYKYRYKGHAVARPAVVAAAADLRELCVLTFRDLIEIQFVHAFRQEGVSWNTIRDAALKAEQLTGGDHPFASRQFVTDGRTIFAEIAQETGNKELLDLRNNQMAFRRVMLPSLRSKLEVGASGVERLWPLGKRRPIVIDPKRQFGQPISREEGVPTVVLANAYSTLRSFDAVARWYDVKRPAVRAAVAFEKSLAA
ncbi:MAG: DUF433 domain-containing protein [Steroidobacteraceae bacterium]